ncbi:hypothetical protein PISL3812_06657 [Talaromyces islandicus]|uniref:Protein FAM32A n=1 Tax=Talaromyces islandicus TaxID=28573 RepID=A0A0U1M223_TALIS|nr:hypothetical protein PISL3812_06657 [Talaromyces islandicus]
MAGDEYSTVGGGGGKLKLKGAKVKDGRVDKKQKKQKKQKDAENKDGKDSVTAATDKPKEKQSDDDNKGQIAKADQPEESEEKRLNDRLRREGVKTHKERVEELNRYLSTLSEHHDMPKIGPG